MEPERAAGRAGEIQGAPLALATPMTTGSIREHIRAAQAAELEGDKASAIGNLLLAAKGYQSAGHFGRALQMLRHALRLDPSRDDVREQLNRLEALEGDQEATTLTTIPLGGPKLPSEELDEAAAEALAAIEASALMAEEAATPREGREAADARRAEEIAAALSSDLAKEVDSAFDDKLAQLQEVAPRAVARGVVAPSTQQGVQAMSETNVENEATDEGGSELPQDVAERLRKSAARAAESRRPRTVNLKMWLGENADGQPAEAPVEPDVESDVREAHAVSESEELHGHVVSVSSDEQLARERADSDVAQDPEAEASEPEQVREAARVELDEDEGELGTLRASLEEDDDEAEEAVPSRKPIERGPTRAGTVDAWCSFCCRPTQEIGELVAGPTGSFICSGCVLESTRFFDLPVSSDTPARSWVANETDDADGELLGQELARAAVERALEGGQGFIVVLGPAGCGKSMFLRELAARGLGRDVPSDGALLVDDGPQLESLAQTIPRALANGRPVVLALRAVSPAPLMTLKAGHGEGIVYSTAALVKATNGRLPVELAEQVETVAVFRGLEAGQLEILAARLVANRPEVVLPPGALRTLVKSAQASGRGGHELKALVRRLPAGNWAPPAKQAKSARKAPKKAAKAPVKKPVAKSVSKKKR
jgi:hypothetical protein